MPPRCFRVRPRLYFLLVWPFAILLKEVEIVFPRLPIKRIYNRAIFYAGARPVIMASEAPCPVARGKTGYVGTHRWRNWYRDPAEGANQRMAQVAKHREHLFGISLTNLLLSPVELLFLLF